jgi:hypothetical protein
LTTQAFSSLCFGIPERCDGHGLKKAEKDMTDFIAQYRIEELSDDELRLKYSEIFNALAARQQNPKACCELQNTLQRIRIELGKRAAKPLGI